MNTVPESIIDKYIQHTMRQYRLDCLNAMEEYGEIKYKEGFDVVHIKITELQKQLKTETELRKRWEIEYYELRDHLRKVIESHEKEGPRREA